MTTDKTPVPAADPSVVAAAAAAAAAAAPAASTTPATIAATATVAEPTNDKTTPSRKRKPKPKRDEYDAESLKQFLGPLLKNVRVESPPPAPKPELTAAQLRKRQRDAGRVRKRKSKSRTNGGGGAPPRRDGFATPPQDVQVYRSSDGESESDDDNGGELTLGSDTHSNTKLNSAILRTDEAKRELVAAETEVTNMQSFLERVKLDRNRIVAEHHELHEQHVATESKLTLLLEAVNRLNDELAHADAEAKKSAHDAHVAKVAYDNAVQRELNRRFERDLIDFKVESREAMPAPTPTAEPETETVLCVSPHAPRAITPPSPTSVSHPLARAKLAAAQQALADSENDSSSDAEKCPRRVREDEAVTTTTTTSTPMVKTMAATALPTPQSHSLYTTHRTYALCDDWFGTFRILPHDGSPPDNVALLMIPNADTELRRHADDGNLTVQYQTTLDELRDYYTIALTQLNEISQVVSRSVVSPEAAHASYHRFPPAPRHCPTPHYGLAPVYRPVLNFEEPRPLPLPTPMPTPRWTPASPSQHQSSSTSSSSSWSIGHVVPPKP